MAKFDGTQDVPSELLDLYRGTLNPHPTGKVVKKRYPYRMPKMQEDGGGASDEQVAQRNRFKTAMGNFSDVETAERERWYDAEPPWSSFLWYYNYFIMSSLAGNANVPQGGAGVIKSIQYLKTSVSANATFSIATAIDPNKAVVMIFGAGYNQSSDQVGDIPFGWAWNVYPIPKILNSSQLEVDISQAAIAAFNFAAIIIEYI